jgi:DNA-binding IscR family transcriptional regulator
MKLTTETVLLLGSGSGASTPVAELAAKLGVSSEEVSRIVEALERSGIVERPARHPGRVQLALPLAEVTMSQIASAAGEWLETAHCDGDPGPWSPGLSQALSVVRQRVFSGLEQIRLA